MATPRRDEAGGMYLQTGQTTCHGVDGRAVACAGSGQDAEFRRGRAWPQPRFEPQGEAVHDRLTGLVWTRDANPAEFPLDWNEALAAVQRWNARRLAGHRDWRLPNRRELRSLISHQTRRPALPAGHPFANVFAGWYWSSTTAAISPAHAWYVDMDGGRMFYGGKDQSFLVWPVRGESRVLPVTGQTCCYDERGTAIACAGSMQDGEQRCGLAWPVPRFEDHGEAVLDRLTGLRWRRNADLAGAVSWDEALSRLAGLSRVAGGPRWRLPNINELESLVDADRRQPALPAGHPFSGVRDVYWSSTTSLYEPDWAWALYLDKGAVGVGQKAQAGFHVWPVIEQSAPSVRR
jgi:hypothetical protein